MEMKKDRKRWNGDGRNEEGERQIFNNNINNNVFYIALNPI